MANVDAPCGFQPWRHLGGRQIHANGYPIASATSASIFTGDAVVLTNGVLVAADAASDGILGIFAGCWYVATDGSLVQSAYWPGATVTSGSRDAIGLVYDDPDIVYRAQTDSGVDFALATHNMTLCDLISTHTDGRTASGQSKQELRVGTTGDEQFLVLQLIDEPNNAVGTHAKVECKIKDSRTASTYSA